MSIKNFAKTMSKSVEAITVKNDVAIEGNRILVTCPFLFAHEGNENDRYYLKSAVEPEVNEFIEKVMNNKFGNNAVMELEHPPLDNDELYFRITGKNGCGRILELWWEGDILMGTYETALDYPMAYVIMGYHRRNVPIGVSVRSMVSYADKKDYPLYGLTGSEPFKVVDLIKIITWDVVMNPGFDNARRLEVVTEDKDYILQNIDSKFVPATEEAYRQLEKDMKNMKKGMSEDEREEYYGKLLNKFLLKF